MAIVAVLLMGVFVSDGLAAVNIFFQFNFVFAAGDAVRNGARFLY